MTDTIKLLLDSGHYQDRDARMAIRTLLAEVDRLQRANVRLTAYSCGRTRCPERHEANMDRAIRRAKGATDRCIGKLDAIDEVVLAALEPDTVVA